VEHILQQSTVEKLPSTYTDIISGKAIPEPESVPDDAGSEAQAQTESESESENQ
jgi:hypothetical protein